ncbi:hypothetical protein [Deminuibacter soli]|uniref:Uncharacterized protein n=1 Tax=Deminuibacter soli TaxID=2291815 RepID=A0A3E1NFB3_9BACT|nr:hypothetical protein [Deminuibacter soli]RFM26567.1 hypothetical protein DXN05_18490 [Deminuibacter soli]
MATITDKDLSGINNLDDLRAKIRSVQVDLKQQETDLAGRWKQLPQEAIKASVGSVVPFFLNNKVAGSTWKLMRTVTTMFLNKRRNDDLKETLWKSTRQLGVFTLLKGAFSLLQKKKAGSPKHRDASGTAPTE